MSVHPTIREQGIGYATQLPVGVPIVNSEKWVSAPENDVLYLQDVQSA